MNSPAAKPCLEIIYPQFGTYLSNSGYTVLQAGADHAWRGSPPVRTDEDRRHERYMAEVQVIGQEITGHDEPLEVQPGNPLPFGATAVPEGINFSIYSRHATACTLVLFKKGARSEERRVGKEWMGRR